MEIVAKIVRFHSSQNKINQSTATNVFQITDHKTEEIQAVEVAEDLAAEVVVEVDLIEDHEKCTKQHVEIVAKIVRFHSSQNKTNQFTAASVFKAIKETRKYTSILDKINPIRTYYVATIVLVIATIVFFILDF